MKKIKELWNEMTAIMTAEETQAFALMLWTLLAWILAEILEFNRAANILGLILLYCHVKAVILPIIREVRKEKREEQ